MTRADDFVFMRAGFDHVAGMHEIEREVFPTPWSYTSLLHDVCGHEISYYIVGLDGETVVSYAGFWFVLDEAHITNVAVKPDYRRMGIGKRMMEILIEEADKRGISTITLEVRESNAAARKLYKELGFRDSGRRKGYYPDNGENAIIMTSVLNSILNETEY